MLHSSISIILQTANSFTCGNISVRPISLSLRVSSKSSSSSSSCTKSLKLEELVTGSILLLAHLLFKRSRRPGGGNLRSCGNNWRPGRSSRWLWSGCWACFEHRFRCNHWFRCGNWRSRRGRSGFEKFKWRVIVVSNSSCAGHCYISFFCLWLLLLQKYLLTPQHHCSVIIDIL